MTYFRRKAARLALAMSVSAVSLGLATTQASALVVVNGTDLAPIVFNGLVDPGAALVPGLSATLDLGPAVFSGNMVSFSYSFTNTTDSVVDALTIDSRIRSFGFNVDAGTGNGLLATSSSTGAYANVTLGAMSPSLGGIGGNRYRCLTATGNGGCTGGPGGLTSGQSTNGTLVLQFQSAASQLFLNDFVVRYQAIEGWRGGDSGIGVASAVPEPSTWAMMLIGFAGLAFASRRRSLQTA